MALTRQKQKKDDENIILKMEIARLDEELRRQRMKYNLLLHHKKTGYIIDSVQDIYNTLKFMKANHEHYCKLVYQDDRLITISALTQEEYDKEEYRRGYGKDIY